MPYLLYHLTELLHIHTQSRTSQENIAHLCCCASSQQACELLLQPPDIQYGYSSPLCLPIRYNLVNLFLPICCNWLPKFFRSLSKSIFTNICITPISFTGEIDTMRLQSHPTTCILLLKSCPKGTLGHVLALKLQCCTSRGEGVICPLCLKMQRGEGTEYCQSQIKKK